MKILFTGPLLDYSGFAVASRRFLQSLLQSKNEVVARALKYDALDPGQKFVQPSWLTEAMSRDLLGVEMCIQMTTCNIEAVPVPGICNALYTFLESDRLQPNWAQKANEFDFLIVPCKANAEAMLRSGVNKPIIVCPICTDADIYNKTYAPFALEQSAGKTIFYNICQLSGKKGIDALLRAYYAAFADRPDEVLLVLKTYINMQDRTNDLNIIKNFIGNIKNAVRIPVPKLPAVLPLTFTMSEDEIYGLHNAGDAYVCSSRAEGWNMPLFDAMCFGKTAITNNKGGMEMYVREENSIIYGGTQTFFFDVQHPDPSLFTGVEQCFEPSVYEMAINMRKYHLLKKGFEAGQLDETSIKLWMDILSKQEEAKKLSKFFDYRITIDKIMPELETAHETWKLTGKVDFAKEEEIV